MDSMTSQSPGRRFICIDSLFSAQHDRVIMKLLVCITIVGVTLTASHVAQSAGRNLRYAQVDVFTDRPLTGNQLAVFLDPKDVSADEMIAITREMGFSESTFVFPAEIPGTDFRVRIFGLNVSGELPVAGHPTIGTVFALASKGLIAPGRSRVVLGLGIGPTAVDLTWNGSRLAFVWMQHPEPGFR